ncbi:hypothetical protein [Mycolicibacterium tusciae]|uniref:hypothetical protein n=1 Tax=Mycolicibacterium tusciae TaxID=75922 RepID=UPI001EF8877F|nr:hypothetical protein [Mycolicibacterium tusciae]
MTLGLYAAIALMDFNQIPLGLQFGLYFLVAAFAMIALRGRCADRRGERTAGAG